MRRFLSLLAVCALSLIPVVASAADQWGPLALPNPFMAPLGLASMHNDAESSNTEPLAGPGPRFVGVDGYSLLAACPTVVQGHDELVLALCTAVLGEAPTVYLIDPRGLLPAPVSLAKLKLTKGSLLGGVYAYLDNNDNMVVIDGSNHLFRIGHAKSGPLGGWKLTINQSTDLSSVIASGDSSIGLVPDYQGNVWFATANGVVGIAKTSGGISSLQLPAGEQVANSISSSPSGRVAVATTFALYELIADGAGNPQVLWRAAYDRGPARKPGQLSWGTGSTPVYFGPGSGADYLTIVDNASPQVHALVFRSGTGQLVCEQPVLTQGGPGSENGPIGIGRSVFVASTYGYPYPSVPANAPPAVPPTAPFVGGMTRVDVDDPGCHTVWDNQARSSAVPHLSTADGYIYTFTRVGPAKTTPLDGFAYTVIDPDTGDIKAHQLLTGSIVNDTLQISPLILMDGKLMQGNLTGIMRIYAFRL